MPDSIRTIPVRVQPPYEVTIGCGLLGWCGDSLAPLLGLADGIVDIVETGTTLKENGLEVVERVADVSARLIVNAASLKLRKEEIETLAGQLEAAIAGRKERESR